MTAPAPTRPYDPLGLYISVPFCQAKCTFCNFASGVYPASAMPAYAQALVQQLASARAWCGAQNLILPDEIDTIYLGGGTPSLLPPELIHTLFGAIREHFNVAPGAEITLEAAPLQLAPETLEAAQLCGVNRISFGVQSFIDGEARATARTHSGAEALSEIERIHRAGVPHISADLIAGLPGQTSATWSQSLEALCAAPLDHASVYMFELDEDSRLGAEALNGGARYGAGLLPNDDAVADWYSQACESLPAHGLAQYEISNFARSGGPSIHNERYWLRRPYLGLGVDAHSMLRTENSAARFATTTDELQAFLTNPAWTAPDVLNPRAGLEESFFLGLRRLAGVSLQSLSAQFPEELLTPFLPVIEDLLAQNLLTRNGAALALTPRGRLLSNNVFGALLEA